LFVAEADTAFRGIGLEDDGFYALAHLQQIAWLTHAFIPGEFREVNQPVDTRKEFDESTEVGEARNGAADAVANMKAGGGDRPGIFFELFQAKRDLFAGGVNFEDFDSELVAGGNAIAGLGDARVRHVGDMKQAVYAGRQLDECAEIHNAANSARDDRAFTQSGEGFLRTLRLLFFEDDAPVDNNILFFGIELGDAALDLLADQLGHLFGVAHSAARRGHEGAHAYIDTKAALDLLGYGTGDVTLGGEGFFEAAPVSRTADFNGGQTVVAFFGAGTDGDGDGSADHGLSLLRFVPPPKRKGALDLSTDVDENGVGAYGDDRARNGLTPCGVGMLSFEVGKYFSERRVLLGKRVVGRREGIDLFGIAHDCSEFPLFCHREAKVTKDSVEGPRKKRSWFRAQDFAWLLFIAALMATAPERNNEALILLPLIGAFQIIEPRLKLFSSRRGQVVSIALKMVLSYLLVGWTHGVESYYHPIFLIPVVSAATTFELGAVIAVTAIAGLAYFSFLLFYLSYGGYVMPPDQISMMSLRVAFFAIVAFLVYEQAKAKRLEMQRTEKTAASLAESNRSLREAQVSLQRSERLAALGQLTAGLAHELRNPLGTIKASAEMLTKSSVKHRPEVMAEMAEYIGTEVNRINGLINSFLNFARPLEIHAAPADLRSVLDDVLRQQAEAARAAEVALTVRMNGELHFPFDAELLKVALSNLVQNAIQASPPHSEVEIRVEEREKEVLIFVSDRGEGIQAAHLESIFNPFFTTKPQGIGLGLPIVAKIVDEHRGHIRVFSEAGKGTRFEMTLPRTETSLKEQWPVNAY
jgi:two-component system sensor histidine kinase HydH